MDKTTEQTINEINRITIEEIFPLLFKIQKARNEASLKVLDYLKSLPYQRGNSKKLRKLRKL